MGLATLSLMRMRIIRTSLLAVAALILFAALPRPARAQVHLDVSLTVFHDRLAGYGDWVTHARYGQVWVPHHEHLWRPYSVGYWTYTDAGWMWVSDEPWAWATYHYGRWAFDDQLGWVWVPDTVWGPSWVAWRSSDEYTGWAPLPPGVVVAEDFEPPIADFAYVFVPTRHLCDTRLATFIEPQARNVTFVRLTTNQTHYSTAGGVVIDRGVRVESVEHVIGRAVPRLTIQATAVAGPARVTAGHVAVYRPATVVEEHPRATPAPPSRAARVETPAQLSARQTAESRTLATDQARQRAELERQHQAELKAPPRGMTHEQVVARQETEHQAQAQNQARQKQVMDARHAQEQHDHGRGRGGT